MERMERVPQLVATKGPLKGRRFAITAAGLMVGRDEACDVVIPDAGVSRQHARVLLHNAAVWVQDEGSRNGVFVNGKRVVRHRQLAPGVEMLIGEHAFTLELAMLDQHSLPPTPAPLPPNDLPPAPRPPIASLAAAAFVVVAALVALLLYTLQSI